MSKGITVHWGMIVALIVLAIGVAILIIFVFKIGNVGESLVGPLIESFKGAMCGAIGGIAGWLLGC